MSLIIDWPETLFKFAAMLEDKCLSDTSVTGISSPRSELEAGASFGQTFCVLLSKSYNFVVSATGGKAAAKAVAGNAIA